MIEQWLRSLPKQHRRQLAPLPDKVEELTRALLHSERYRQGRFLTALAQLLRDRFRVTVGEADWSRERVDPQWLLNIRVLDDQGRVLAMGRDFHALKSKLNQQPTHIRAPVADAKGIVAFPDHDLPVQQVVQSKGAPVMVFPGLIDRQDKVDVHWFDKPAARDVANRQGFARLALLQLGKVGGFFRRSLDKHPHLGLHFAALGSAQELKDELLLSVVWYCYFEGQPLPETAQDFARRLTDHRGELGDVFNQVIDVFAEAMAYRFRCRRTIEDLQSKAFDQSKAHIAVHLDNLVPKNVLAITPLAYLSVLPRYLAGIEYRLSHLRGHVPRDQKLMAELRSVLERLERLRTQKELYDDQRWQALRFYVEELRLYLFAEPVARQRWPNHPLVLSHFGTKL